MTTFTERIDAVSSTTIGHGAGCRHAPFSLDDGDRAQSTYAEALTLALHRAPARGRQTVRRHVGWIFKRGVWFVQDARPVVTS